MPAALTDEGLTIETMPEIREGMNSRARALWGPGIDTSDGAYEGQTFGIVSERIALCHELLEVIYNATNPDAATGARQDEIGAITGALREGAASSIVTATLVGDSAVVVPTGSLASVVDTDLQFKTLADATLVALSAWTAITVYAIGDRCKNGDNAYEAVGPGTSAASGGPVAVDPADIVGETDGSVLWRFLGEGEAAVDVAMSSVDTGEIVANAGSLTQIETPYSGWNAVTNIFDATLGRPIESNEAFRIRREDELFTPGTSPLDAIRAELLTLDGVTAVTIFQNTEDVTDADGVPPHAIEALVQGGVDQEIWDKLLAAGAAGFKTYGDETGVSTDSAGNDWDMAFSRPEELPIYVIMNVIKNPDTFPTDGAAQIKAAVVAFGDAQLAGKDAVASKIGAQAFTVGESVLDVPTVYIGVAPAPATSTTIAVSLRQLAIFDTSFITVNLTDGVP